MAEAVNMQNMVDVMASLERKDASDKFWRYCEIVNGRKKVVDADGSVRYEKNWKRSNFHIYLCNRVQEFIERPSIKPYEVLIIEAPVQHGKLLSDDTPILTPNGWTNHGQLKVGDFVFGRDGKPKKVLAQFNHGVANYEVEFNDGEKIKCHTNHEWVVYDRCGKREKVLTTGQMAKTKLQVLKDQHYRYKVDANTLVEFPERELFIHPYVFGAWLGDGSTTKNCITHHPSDDAIIEKIERCGYKRTSTCVHKSTGIHTSYFKSLYKPMKNNGFGCVGGMEKHIPDAFKFSSKEQRLELLAGLIDTDGCVYQKNGRVTFSNINKRLIDDVRDLCISLGFRVTICEYPPKMSTSGILGKSTVYQLSFNPSIMFPTVLERKKINKLTTKTRRSIKSITPIEEVSGKCIMVEDEIYLAGLNLVPTHNSFTITETLPSWCLGKFKDKRIMQISYNTEFAAEFAKENRKKIEQYGEYLFDVKLDRRSKKQDEIILAGHRGEMSSYGILSGITGNPGDIIVIDDPIKNSAEANSETYRNNLWKAWQSEIKTRTHPGSKIIIVMSRWHEDDISGRIMANETAWEELRLPCECDSEDDPLGREIGDALCPEIGKDKAWKDAFKADYIRTEGLGVWNAMFQGRPSSEKGNIIKREWWRFYDELPRIDLIIMSVDCTFKGKESSDKVAITVWGKTGSNVYLMDVVNKQMGFNDTLRAVRDMKAKYPQTSMVLIEDKANGSAVIETLRSEIMGVIAIEPKGGKEARVAAVTPYIEAGNVWLPKRGAYTDEFIDQCASFPKGKFDDLVDSMSQALTRLKDYKAHAPKKAERYGEFSFEQKKSQNEHALFGFAVPKNFFKF